MSDQGGNNGSTPAQPAANGDGSREYTQPGLESVSQGAPAGRSSSPASGSGAAIPTKVDGGSVEQWLAANKVEALNKLNQGDTKAMDQYREVLYAHARGEQLPSWFTGTQAPPPARNEDGHIMDSAPLAGATEAEMSEVETYIGHRADLGPDRHVVTSIIRELNLPAVEAKVIADRVAEHHRLGGGQQTSLTREQIDVQTRHVQQQLGPKFNETVSLAAQYLKSQGLEQEWNPDNLGTLALDPVLLQRLANAGRRAGFKA